MDIVKSLQIRRKSSSKRHDYDEGGEDKTRSTEQLDKSLLQLKRQYIFIPHTSLDKFEYIKNDIMFLEFIVNKWHAMDIWVAGSKFGNFFQIFMIMCCNVFYYMCTR